MCRRTGCCCHSLEEGSKAIGLSGVALNALLLAATLTLTAFGTVAFTFGVFCCVAVETLMIGANVCLVYGVISRRPILVKVWLVLSLALVVAGFLGSFVLAAMAFYIPDNWQDCGVCQAFGTGKLFEGERFEDGQENQVKAAVWFVALACFGSAVVNAYFWTVVNSFNAELFGEYAAGGWIHKINKKISGASRV